MLVLRLFGSVQVEGKGAVLAGRAAQKKRLALLALLGAAPTRVLSRDKAVALLWPEADTERARHQLASSVYELRRALGEDAIESSGDELRLNGARIQSELWEFDSALKHEDWQRVVDLYRGPFLDGFFLSDAPEFERWADTERDRLARSYGRALEALAEGEEQRGAFAPAVGWWRRLAAHDPYSSRIALRLMQALGASGEAGAAVRHAQAHEALLREELELPPDPAVSEMAARMRRGETLRAAPTLAVTHGLPRDDVATPAYAPAAGEPERVRTEPNALANSARTYGRIAVGAVVVAVLALSYWGIALHDGSPQGGARAADAAPHAQTVAVLPFVNLSADPAQEYLSDGLTEDILGRLALAGGWRVISRTSVMPYKSSTKSLRAIGQELGASHIVEGSVRRDGDRLRVTVQLIDARTDHHLWSASYDRDFDDVFGIQSDVAEQVALALHAELGSAARGRLAFAPTTDPHAYDHYLRALDYGRRYTVPEIEIAIGLLHRALELDPDFALARARLGRAYLVSYGYGAGESRIDAAAAEADRLLSSVPELADGYVVRGMVHLARGEYSDARNALERAAALDPGDASDYSPHFVSVSAAAGNVDQALAWSKRAYAAVDPANRPMILCNEASLYASLGLFGRAEESLRRASELGPDLACIPRERLRLAIHRHDIAAAVGAADALVAHWDDPQSQRYAAHAFLRANDPDRARELFERAMHTPTHARVPLAVLLWRSGERERATAFFADHEADTRARMTAGNEDCWLRHWLGVAHAVQGRTREALRWLDESLAHGCVDYYWNRHDPLLDDLRGDPGFDRFLARQRARLSEMRPAVQ